MRSRRLACLALVGVLGLSACGTGSAGETEQAVTEQPTTEVSTPPTADSSEPTEPAAPPAAPPTAPPADDAGEPPTTAPAGEPAVVTDAEQAPPPAVLGGRLLGDDLRPEADFVANPLPNLTVIDVGRDTPVNVRNILPSDRPVLLWTWAPH